jgi:ParB family chromosome partitioning protein
MVIDKKLTTGHVRPLLTIEETDTQYKLAQTSYEQKLSVRQVEQLVKTFKTPPKPKVKKDLEKYQVHYDEFAGKLAEKLGTKVSASLSDKEKGKIEIEFYSSDEFEKFFELLMQ